MKRLFDRLLYKIAIIIVVILFIVAFREMVYTDSTVGAFFSSLIGQIPFAKVISDNVCKILKFKQTLPIADINSVLSDALRLVIMACIQPVIIDILTKIFLPFPRITNQILMTSYKRYEMQEEYMNSLSYKIKELLLNIIAVPLLAIMASYLTAQFFVKLKMLWGDNGIIAAGTIIIVLLVILSILQLCLKDVWFGRAIVWRLVITLFTNIANMFVINTLCVSILLALMGRVSSQIVGSIAALVLWMIIFDFALQCMKRAIAGCR